jgi:two-component system copper resistance phosphate regulon response regulator CusR
VVNVLVIEDEELIAAFVEKGLRAHGYGVVWVRNGREGLERAAGTDISLVILDLGLPDLDGLEVLRGLRERGGHVPVLVLSARTRVADRVEGLNLGADDYLVKPFAFEELLARVRANLRRDQRSPGTLLHVGGVQLDLLLREVTVDGRSVRLSGREFALLKAFVTCPRRVLSRQELLSMAWDMHFDTRTNLVDVYVRYLRRKLGEHMIVTVPRVGYRLRDQPGAIAETPPRPFA